MCGLMKNRGAYKLLRLGGAATLRTLTHLGFRDVLEDVVEQFQACHVLWLLTRVLLSKPGSYWGPHILARLIVREVSHFPCSLVSRNI